jgi:uncharacterized protein (TIGR03435 family)
MIRIKRALAGAAFLTFVSIGGVAQTPATPAPAATPPTFQLADIHTSPHSNTPFARGGDLHGDRYQMRQATMVDLIAKAYDVDNANVIGGPAWLDTDRFDIVATAPRTTSPEDVRLMLRALLADRFKLVTHTGSKDLPAFVLIEGSGKPKLNESDGAAESSCGPNPKAPPPAPGPTNYIWVSCHNMTSADIAKNLHQMAGGYLTNPVVDLTGLKGTYDFDIKWTGKGALAGAGADGISIFDAVDKQLGLKLEAKTAPFPVIMVDSVDEKPAPNAPGIEKAFPPSPPPAFDVAVIKPGNPDAKGMQGQITKNQVNLTGVTMQFLITWAWQLNPNDKEALVGAPKWLDQDKFDILGKVAPDPNATAAKGAPPIDFDDLQQMVRTLLMDRFNLKVHIEDRPEDAYTLIAANPKLKKGDPTMRTGCHEGPGPDGKDPRIANPILDRLLTCQNMNMGEFGDELRLLAGGFIFNPVLDETGLQGGYDFTLSFSNAGNFQGGAGAPPPPPGNAAATASDPSGAISLFDAISKELGLKLEKQKRPEPALVIDHIDPKPTEN